MLKKTIILIILSLATISCEKPEPQEKTYTIVLNKEEYEKRVAEIENEINNKNYKKAEEMLLEIAKYNKAAYDKGLKDAILLHGSYRIWGREYWKSENGKEIKNNEGIKKLYFGV